MGGSEAVGPCLDHNGDIVECKRESISARAVFPADVSWTLVTWYQQMGWFYASFRAGVTASAEISVAIQNEITSYLNEPNAYCAAYTDESTSVSFTPSAGVNAWAEFAAGVPLIAEVGVKGNVGLVNLDMPISYNWHKSNNPSNPTFQKSFTGSMSISLGSGLLYAYARLLFAEIARLELFNWSGLVISGDLFRAAPCVTEEGNLLGRSVGLVRQCGATFPELYSVRSGELLRGSNLQRLRLCVASIGTWVSKLRRLLEYK